MKKSLQLTLRINAIFLTLAVTILPLASEGQKSALNTFLSGNAMKHASVSFLAVDLNTSDTLLQHKINTSLCPASVTKIVSTATALELFGSGHTFITLLKYTGEIKSGVLEGDLIIYGGGDPALGSKNFSYYEAFLEKWADAVSSAGIKKIKGAVVSDISYFSRSDVPDGWTWGDIGNYFGAAPMSLNGYDNEFTVTFKTGSKSDDNTSVVSISPEIPYMTFVNNVKTGNVSGDNSMIYGSVTDRTRTAEGLLPIGRSAFEVRGAIPMPPLLIANDFRNALYAKGIASDTFYVSAINDSIKSTQILSFPSVALKDIVSVTNKVSMNMYAEMLFRHAGRKLNQNAANPSGEIEKYWGGKINTSGFFIEDGSGLSRSNAFNASNLVSLLTYMKKSKNFDVFYESLPVAGKSGTISGMFKNTYAEDNLRAKSGSLNRVRCYAGYVTTRSGKEVAFALLVNNFSCSQSEMKSRIEKLLLAICDL